MQSVHIVAVNRDNSVTQITFPTIEAFFLWQTTRGFQYVFWRAIDLDKGVVIATQHNG